MLVITSVECVSESEKRMNVERIFSVASVSLDLLVSPIKQILNFNMDNAGCEAENSGEWFRLLVNCSAVKDF